MPASAVAGQIARLFDVGQVPSPSGPRVVRRKQARTIEGAAGMGGGVVRIVRVNEGRSPALAFPAASVATCVDSA